MPNITRPNFFIIGAPRSGTTSLYNYVRKHPNVFVPSLKEPTFFCDDLHEIRPKKRLYITDLGRYLELFENIPYNAHAVGEASAWYLHSTRAIHNILEFNHAAKFIAIVRNPIEMVQSLHAALLKNQDEDEPDFEKAWSLQDARREGRHLPRTCQVPDELQYAMVGRLGERIEHLLTIAPRDQVKLLLFDDLVQSPQAVFHDALDFLDLRIVELDEYPVYNDRKAARVTWITNLLKDLPEPLALSVRTVKSLTGVRELRVKWLVNVMNSKKVTRRQLSRECHAKLVEAFEPDIKKISRSLDRNLSHWLKCPG